MSRWQPNARGRLERAAIELFSKQGFAATTVPQIAARAGLTTRTFFRHFADKREVLFAGDEELPALVARLVAGAPAALGPLPVIARGLEAATATRFDGRRDYLRARRAIVQTDEGLRERELRKLAAMTDAIGRAFRERGVDELAATLAAQLAVTVFSVTLDRWLDQDGERPLAELARDTLRALRAVAAEPAEPAHGA
jgi:AcrR family transcriptional regulator